MRWPSPLVGEGGPERSEGPGEGFVRPILLTRACPRPCATSSKPARRRATSPNCARAAAHRGATGTMRVVGEGWELRPDQRERGAIIMYLSFSPKMWIVYTTTGRFFYADIQKRAGYAGNT